MTSCKTDLDQWIASATALPLLPQDKILEIAGRIQSLPEGNPKRARLVNKLVEHNLRLVIHFVKKFMATSHQKWGGPETTDYLQVGAMGLHRAAEKFDPTRGYSFSTYATHWIRSLVGRYNLKTITPVYVSETMSRQLIFYSRNGFVRSKRSGEHWSEGEVQQAIRATSLAYECVSLDVETESRLPLGDTIASGAMTPDEIVTSNFLENACRTLGQIGLTNDEIHTIIESEVNDKTIQQIADNMGTTIHRVKRFKKKAIGKAKQHRNAVLAGIL